MKVGPSRGDVAVRLMWSLIRTGVPGPRSGSMPPQPLVSTSVEQPAAAAVRTACTTGRTPRPSYRWVRDRKTRAWRSAPASSVTLTERTVPTCPRAAAGAKPGSSVTGTSAVVAPSRSAVTCQPEPSTRAVSWRATPVRSAIARAAAAAISKGSVPGSAWSKAGLLEWSGPAAAALSKGSITPGTVLRCPGRAPRSGLSRPSGRGARAAPRRSRPGRRRPRRRRRASPGRRRSARRPRSRRARTSTPAARPRARRPAP